MPPETDLLRAPLGAVVVGPELFASALVAQGIPVRRVDWRPPGSPEALASLWCDAVDTANRIALDRLLAAHQILVDVRPAIEVVPGMTRETILHAGPPIAWEDMSGPMRGGVVGALIYKGSRRVGRTPSVWSRAARFASIPAIITRPWDRWRAPPPRRCRSWWWRTAPRATAPTRR